MPESEYPSPPYHRLRGQRWRERVARAEWYTPTGRIGMVVLQVRERGRVANRRALWVLSALLLAVLLGLFFFLGRPLIEIWSDGQIGAWRQIEQTLRDRQTDLDDDRKELRDRLAESLRWVPQDPVDLTPESNEGFR
ncbi:MAG: hypothetical protein AAFR46_02200, partial [Pseudomonadota bacterium]